MYIYISYSSTHSSFLQLFSVFLSPVFGSILGIFSTFLYAIDENGWEKNLDLDSLLCFYECCIYISTLIVNWLFWFGTMHYLLEGEIFISMPNPLLFLFGHDAVSRWEQKVDSSNIGQSKSWKTCWVCSVSDFSFYLTHWLCMFALMGQNFVCFAWKF